MSSKMEEFAETSEQSLDFRSGEPVSAGTSTKRSVEQISSEPNEARKHPKEDRKRQKTEEPAAVNGMRIPEESTSETETVPNNYRRAVREGLGKALADADAQWIGVVYFDAEGDLQQTFYVPLACELGFDIIMRDECGDIIEDERENYERGRNERRLAALYTEEINIPPVWEERMYEMDGRFYDADSIRERYQRSCVTVYTVSGRERTRKNTSFHFCVEDQFMDMVLENDDVSPKHREVLKRLAAAVETFEG